ncbi:MAG: hypothetical protein Fur0039_16610 [Rhodocyclaceae bacterium]
MRLRNDGFQGCFSMNDQNDVRSEDAEGGVVFTEAPRVTVAPRRRRLLTGGMAAAPILLTVASRSALANVCPSPSRVFSGMASPNPSDHFSCNGRSPGYWKTCQHFGEWPLDPPTVQVFSGHDWSGCSTGTPSQPDKARFVGGDYGASFHALFSAACVMLKPVVAPTSGREVSLWEVFAFPTDVATASGTSAEKVQLARHCIAAYFNALKFGSTYPVTSAQALAMWADGSCGSYCPLASCTDPWTPAEIIAYIKGTFDGVDLDY